MLVRQSKRNSLDKKLLAYSVAAGAAVALGSAARADIIHYDGPWTGSDQNETLVSFNLAGQVVTDGNIHKTIAEVVTLLEHGIDKRIVIQQLLRAAPPMAMGDPSQIQNALLNVALNARDAMPDGGELAFATEVVALDDEYCRSHPNEIAPGRFLQISITDSGNGIDAATMKRIFEPFFTTKERGTGMGLAAVYGTVKNHNGAISVDSEPGRGTMFRLHLPLAEPAPDQSAGVAAAAPVRGIARVLIVDDEEVVRHVAAAMLRDLGYKVVLCDNGEEAVGYYRRSWQRVDLVLLDMVMPQMGGHDTFLAMRRINPDVRALLSSGYSVDGEAQSILDEGVLGFVQKPFKMAELARAITEALPQ